MPAPCTIVCDTSGVRDADVGVVEALARLALAARRTGLELALVGVGSELRELIELAGLGQVLLGGEAVRQAEQREQAGGVEEEGELDDGAG